MSALVDEEKRRMLIAQIERTAEEIRKGQKNVFCIGRDHTHLFGLRTPGVYPKFSSGSRMGLVSIWFLVVIFLVSSTLLLIFMKECGVV
ncbi:hypothetical protein KMI_05g08420 [Encephalitozoon hellem]|uniref:Uncharacterized protein n=1 Tax=Encephalitozoon hellem TaxID=27973 RepID=A0A9Q9C2X8_ENCHE|nr:uncharacterized protein EHEL_050525 [Encephalitozoon hellem ATCC 50504]AHL28928.1 hypothetical protein EHEL_050525 [Encephalitozoon hellem ATCC 50504]KAG5859660.1 hypothetical protein KMI_05g08420 [Encephalitozoon hellem]UTX43141.1 hypothetical protein GPU96_05g08800 [Encephalitozoon hellem]WEL38598.1 hypothetical protein PFJ87_05g00660 [Encephalitozoon hellem]